MSDHPVPDDVIPFPNPYEQPCPECNPTGLAPVERRGFVLTGPWRDYMDKKGHPPPQGHALRRTQPTYRDCGTCDDRLGWLPTPWGDALLQFIERHLYNREEE